MTETPVAAAWQTITSHSVVMSNNKATWTAARRRFQTRGDVPSLSHFRITTDLVCSLVVSGDPWTTWPASNPGIQANVEMCPHSGIFQTEIELSCLTSLTSAGRSPLAQIHFIRCDQNLFHENRSLFKRFQLLGSGPRRPGWRYPSFRTSTGHTVRN